MTWTKPQRNVVIAAYLGWTLDAFDFFLMVFMFKDISVELHSSRQVVVTAVLLTLAMRPVGAFLFGRLGDRYGRKPALMWNILAYSLLEVASGFAPSMTTLLIVRALFGIAMGGEWGLGSALAMESIPASARRLLPRIAGGIPLLRPAWVALHVRAGGRPRRTGVLHPQGH
jgi:SHS family lactate transporter-like MFS transporter